MNLLKGACQMAMERTGRFYTYTEYASWDDSVRYELIDGIPYMMTAPKWEHQSVSMSLSRQFSNYLEGKPCMVFAEDNMKVQCKLG
jgi:Uma2 family endonuclease